MAKLYALKKYAADYSSLFDARTLVDRGYVDTKIASALSFQGAWDASGGTLPTTRPDTSALQLGDTFVISVAGTVTGLTPNPDLEVGDMIVVVTVPVTGVANRTAIEGNKDQATESARGTAKIATQAITNAGTNDTDIVTPLKLATKMARVEAASEVGYDNTTSGLTADNVQAAIDEVLEYAEDNVGLVGTKEVDETDIGDGKVLVYNTVSGKLEYASDAGGDMLKSVYDPNTKEADAFDSANHDYDNTDSGLTADNVQDAIDELAEDTISSNAYVTTVNTSGDPAVATVTHGFNITDGTDILVQTFIGTEEVEVTIQNITSTTLEILTAVPTNNIKVKVLRLVA